MHLNERHVTCVVCAAVSASDPKFETKHRKRKAASFQTVSQLHKVSWTVHTADPG